MNEAEQRLRDLSTRLKEYTERLRTNTLSKEEIQRINSKLDELDPVLDKLQDLYNEE